MTSADVGRAVAEWLAKGGAGAFARVSEIRGIGSAATGEMVAWNDTGDRQGEVLGGAADEAIRAAALRLPAGDAGALELVDVTVDDAGARQAGLSCGGGATVVVQSVTGIPGEFWAALAERRPVALVTAAPAGPAVGAPSGAAGAGSSGAVNNGPSGVAGAGSSGAVNNGPSGAVDAGPSGVAGAGSSGAVNNGPSGAAGDGSSGAVNNGPSGAVDAAPSGAVNGGSSGALVVVDGGGTFGSLGGPAVDAAAEREARRLLSGGETASRRVQLDQGTVLVDAFVPDPIVVIAGDGAIAEAIARQAATLGWPAAVTTDVDEATAALDEAGASAALVLLSHSAKLDVPVLAAAIERRVPYIGALGSARTQQRRAERLRALGVADADIGAIHGPIGLDLGGNRPASIALAVCAEILAVRNHRGAVSLKGRTAPIRLAPAGADALG